MASLPHSCPQPQQRATHPQQQHHGPGLPSAHPQHCCLQILVLEENKELRWRDYRGPIISQFFRGSHWWILERLPNGHTRFLHGAEMFGLALPFVQSSMHATRRGYHVWNKALREEVLARLQQVGCGWLFGCWREAGVTVGGDSSLAFGGDGVQCEDDGWCVKELRLT